MYKFRILSEKERFLPALCTDLSEPAAGAVEAWHDQTRNLRTCKMEMLKEMKDLEVKLAYIRKMLVSQNITPEDYQKMKVE